MKKQLRHQNIFWILSAVFVVGVFALSLFPSITFAVTPPENAKCENQFGLPKNTFVCKGDRVGVSMSVSGNSGGCIDVCRNDAEGLALRYDEGRFITTMNWYCFGATQTAYCVTPSSNGKTYIDLLGGGTITKEEYTLKQASEDCTTTFCAISNLVTNLPFLLLFGIPVAFSTAVVWLAGVVASLVAGLLGGLLKTIIIATLSIPVIPGAIKIKAIEAGWMFSRDFVNLLFLLFAVFMGLATILRLENYQAKKTLPKLLIAALLVNFSGVLVGIVVDFSNLLTKFFIERLGTWGGIGNSLSNSTSMFLSAIWNLIGGLKLDPSTYVGNMIEPVASLAVMAIFYAILLLALFVVMIVFVARVAVLWILTIMAPFAFASYAIPGMKKLWDEWIKTLISWAIVGIPLGFFLYISSSLVTNLVDIAALMPAKAGEGEGIAGVLKSILGPITVVAILIYGLNFSKKMAPAAAQELIKWGTTAGMGLATGGAALVGGSVLASKFGQKMLERGAKTKMGHMSLQDLRAKNSATPNLFGRLGNTGLFLGSQFAGGTKWLTRTASVRAMEWSNAQNKGVDAKMANLEKRFGKNYKNISASYGTLGPLDYQGRIATALQLAKMKGGKGLAELPQDQLREAVALTAKYRSGDLMDIVKHMPKLHKDEKVGDIIERTLMSDSAKQDRNGNYIDSNVQEVTLDHKERTGSDFASDKERVRAALRRKLTMELKASDLENLDKGLADNAEFKEDIAHWKPWEFIRKMGEEWGSDIVEKLQGEAEKLTGNDLSKLMKVNPTFVRGFLTPQGRLYMRQWNNSAGGAAPTPLDEDRLKIFLKTPAAGTRRTVSPEPLDPSRADPDLFPEIHSLFFGKMPAAKAPLMKRLKKDMPNDLQTLIRGGNELANTIKQRLKDEHAAQQEIDELRSIGKIAEATARQAELDLKKIDTATMQTNLEGQRTLMKTAFDVWRTENEKRFTDDRTKELMDQITERMNRL